MTDPRNALHIDHLTMQFGGVVAVDDLTMDINEGEIVALIGPNGAGKTTAFNAVTGVYPPTNGEISFHGEPIVRARPAGKMKKLYQGDRSQIFTGPVLSPTPDRITGLGIARTFQNIRLFAGLTVLENVLLAQHLRRHSGFISAALHLNGEEERDRKVRALELLDIAGLAGVRDEMAVSLPYGRQRLLEIIRALATGPSLLLLDEPAAGMNPQETLELARFIQKLRLDFALTVFVIEHHMDLVMNISDRVYVIEFGRLISQGTPAQVQADPAVIRAYLGGEDE